MPIGANLIFDFGFYTSNGSQIANQFAKQWNFLWESKNPEQSWQALYDITFPVLQPFHSEPIVYTVFDLLAVLKKMNSQSSIGFDAWTPTELKSLPLDILQTLVDIFNMALRHKNPWPTDYCRCIVAV